MVIKNREALLSHGNVEGRRVLLDLLDAAVEATTASYDNTRKITRIDNDNLILGHPDFSEPLGQKPINYKLSELKNIYIVGAGKAVQPIGKALEDTLGELITQGQFNLKKGEKIVLKRINVTSAGHPIPDENCIRGARKMMEILEKAQEGDIVFWCNSGGSSSLLALPVPGVSLEELQQVYRILFFECGATMPETNAVRNMLVVLQMRHPKIVKGATLVQITAPETPTKIRAHTFQQISLVNTYGRAVGVLKKYNCWDRIPQSVRNFLSKEDPKYLFPTPEELNQRPYHIYRVMGPEYLIEGARNKSESLGLRTAVLATSMNDIEAKPAAEVLANIAMEIEAMGRPHEPPCVLICGGEVVVAIGKATGIGGRNQEFVLSMAPILDGSENIAVASMDSDGTDGPTDIAGGVVDGYTMERIREANIDLNAELGNHNSGFVLGKLGDQIFTGSTSTNMRDIRIMYISGKMANARGSIV